MADSPAGTRASRRTLVLWTVVAIAVRLAAAFVVQGVVDRRGEGHCLFPDTEIYWHLGREIRAGRPFAVPQAGGPHYALRTPGYPLFLAACGAIFGEKGLPIRLAQAALTASCVPLLYALVRRICPEGPAAITAAAIAAVEPYTVGISVVLLSEAIFIPLMLLGLLGLATAWPARSLRSTAIPAAWAGAAFGAGVLVKPSWALFPPLAATAWLLARRSREAALGAACVAIGLALVMAPWWVRNARVYGRFVPTALWAGASLYDGLGPGATGASDMRFLDRPEFRPLDETTQDRALLARSREIVRADPARAVRLAWVKSLRYWSPWPNDRGFRSSPAAPPSALATVPLYALMLIGLWRLRAEPRAWALLAGPIVYFALIHAVFVSSIRYRLPGMVPAFGLAGAGVAGLVRRRTARGGG